MAELRRMRPWLGTFVEIRVAGPDAGALVRAVEAAFAAIAQVHARMAFHEATSDLSRLNRDAAHGPVVVDPWTYAVLAAALDLSARSGGLFDVSVAPTLVRDGFLPPVVQAPAPDSAATWRDIELMPDRQVRFHRPLQVDLGGIAKGFAVDRAVEALGAGGAVCGIVNAGGDLRVFGDIEQPIRIRDPSAPRRTARELTLRAAALATSAPCFALRSPRGRRVSPLIDPRSGRSCTRTISVTVQAAECLYADALTKVVLADATAAAPILSHYGAQAWVLEPAPRPRRRSARHQRSQVPGNAEPRSSQPS